MRLTDLNPEWIKIRGRDGLGVRFACPHCRVTQICVLFMNPLDGGKPVPKDSDLPGENDGKRWARSGMTFDELTINPSIDAEGHWHGFVLDGEVQ